MLLDHLCEKCKEHFQARLLCWASSFCRGINGANKSALLHVVTSLGVSCLTKGLNSQQKSIFYLCSVWLMMRESSLLLKTNAHPSHYVVIAAALLLCHRIYEVLHFRLAVFAFFLLLLKCHWLLQTWCRCQVLCFHVPLTSDGD